jgi:hypothetical protein
LANAIKSEEEAKNAVGGRVVLDPFTQKPLGEAKDKETASTANTKQQAYHVFRQKLARNKEIEDALGLTNGVRQLRGGDADTLVAEHDGNNAAMANALAKMRDPVGAISDPSVAQAREGLPSYNTLFGEGPEAAAGKRKQLETEADQAVLQAMGAAGLDFDPTKYYTNRKKPSTTTDKAFDSASKFVPPIDDTHNAWLRDTGREHRVSVPLYVGLEQTAGLNWLAGQLASGSPAEKAAAANKLVSLANNPGLGDIAKKAANILKGSE